MLTTNQILHQGRYRIVNQLGQNGVGIGYEAFDNVLETNVLLKEIRDNLGKVATVAQIEARKTTFAGQAKILTEIKHESVLPIRDFFSEIDCHYLVSEFIDGNTLGELLEKKTSPFPLADISGWADSLLDALNYLHTLNPQIIHREVKPQNIKLSQNGKVKLLVFNIVKNAGENVNALNANQTFDAAVLPYLPLEQIWNGLDSASQKVILTNYDDKSEKILEQPLDARTDIYALGATLYHLLTARIPADALTRSIDILEGKADPLQTPSQINPSVPTEISDVLMKALEIKRENRFSSAVIMRQVLRTAFVRVKERGVNEVKPIKIEDDAVLEIPFVPVPAKPLMPKLPLAAPINPEIESEQVRQLELIKQQLREAEERRLEAEQRATEAEKRLVEVEKHITIEPAAKAPEVVEEFTPIAPVEVLPKTKYEAPVNAVPVKEHSSDEFSTLFAEPEKQSNVFKKVAAAAVVLVILGGAAFGIWSFVKPKSAESMQTSTSSNAAAIPAPTTETTPAPTTEVVPSYQTTSETTPANSPSTETTTATSNPTAVKTKTVAAPTPAPAKKPATAPAKTPEQKKAVTLDDLIKDN
jgi:serine/threonine protein kinase